MIWLIDSLAIPELTAGLVDPGVLLAEEVLSLEDRCDFVDGLGVDEEGGDDRLFGIHVMRRKFLRAPGFDDHLPVSLSYS